MGAVVSAVVSEVVAVTVMHVLLLFIEIIHIMVYKTILNIQVL